MQRFSPHYTKSIIIDKKLTPAKLLQLFKYHYDQLPKSLKNESIHGQIIRELARPFNPSNAGKMPASLKHKQLYIEAIAHIIELIKRVNLHTVNNQKLEQIYLFVLMQAAADWISYNTNPLINSCAYPLLQKNQNDPDACANIIEAALSLMLKDAEPVKYYYEYSRQGAILSHPFHNSYPCELHEYFAGIFEKSTLRKFDPKYATLLSELNIKYEEYLNQIDNSFWYVANKETKELNKLFGRLIAVNYLIDQISLNKTITRQEILKHLSDKFGSTAYESRGWFKPSRITQAAEKVEAITNPPSSFFSRFQSKKINESAAPVTESKEVVNKPR